MPELPEVETVRRQLSQVIVGKTVAAVDVFKEKSWSGKISLAVGQTVRVPRFDALHGRSWTTSIPRNALARTLAPELHPPDLASLVRHFTHLVELVGAGAVRIK